MITKQPHSSKIVSQIMSGIMEEKDVLQRKPTLARRVSNMFKGKYTRFQVYHFFSLTLSLSIFTC